jgi:hypothetical protein
VQGVLSCARSVACAMRMHTCMCKTHGSLPWLYVQDRSAGLKEQSLSGRFKPCTCVCVGSEAATCYHTVH